MMQTVEQDENISIVVPNYNHGIHLEKRIRSFLDQSHPPSEIVIVDDASTDDSRSIILFLAEAYPQIIPLMREKNGGVNEALAVGLEKASSTYVVLASADDVCLPNFLGHSVRMLADHPDAAFVFSDPAEHIDATGEQRVFEEFLGSETMHMTADQFMNMQRRRSFRIPTNTVMFRRDRLVEIGGFLDDLHWHADWFAIMRLGMTYGACYVPEVLCYVRVCEDSYSVTSLKQKSRHAEVIAKCLKYVYESGDKDLERRFRRSALMPQHDLALLPRLLTYEAFRRHVTPTLIGWMVVRQAWSLIRPFATIGWRKALRRTLNRRSPI